MAVTIGVNKLSLVHESSDGVAMATAPDVCNTPTPVGPVPIPYPNVALSSSLAKGTKRVLVDGGSSAAIDSSEFGSSTGDEAGSSGGVGSGATAKEATWLTYSFDVWMEGANACRLTDKMLMNQGNTVCAGGVTQATVAYGLPGLELDSAVHRELEISKPKQDPKCFFGEGWPNDLKSWLSPEYGHWCGATNAPADEAGVDFLVDDDVIQSTDSALKWVLDHGLPEPTNALDRACMMHDLRLSNLSKKKYPDGSRKVKFNAADKELSDIHRQLRNDLEMLAFDFSEPIDLCGRMFAVAGALGFNVLTPYTHPRYRQFVVFLGALLVDQGLKALPGVVTSLGAMRTWEALFNNDPPYILIDGSRVMIGFSYSW